ncbi:MAG: hypothetical protein WDO69_32755 [Pseudomonadota bacterium]
MMRLVIRFATTTALLSLLSPKAALAQGYPFDTGSTQSWTLAGMYSQSSGLTPVYTNPFALSWDDTRQYPGSPTAPVNNDPTSNNLGSVRISTQNLVFPGFPVNNGWFIDLGSPTVTAISGWQNIQGVSYKVRCDDSLFVGNGRFLTAIGALSAELVLAVTRKSDGVTTFVSPTSYVGGQDFVFETILTDQLTDAEQDPFHWMSLNARFSDLSNYTINRVIIRLLGTGPQTSTSNYGPFACNIDNVQPITSTQPTVRVHGTVTMARTTQCAGTTFTNDINVQYDSDFAPSIRLTGVALNFTNSNVQKGTYTAVACDQPDNVTATWVNTRQLNLSPGYQVDPGEKFRHSEALKRVTGSGALTASDFSGATAQLTFAGLPASCVVPLKNLTALGTSRAIATFDCPLPVTAAPATPPAALALLGLALLGGGFVSLRYRRRAA